MRRRSPQVSPEYFAIGVDQPTATTLLLAAFKNNGRSVFLSLARELESPFADLLVRAQEGHSRIVSDTNLWIPYRSFRSA